MYNDISFQANLRKAPIFKMSKQNFEVNPLDVNIAKLQFNMLNRLEREVPENGDFAPVVEEYLSKDPTLDLSKVKLTCKFVKDEAPKKDTRLLELICSDKESKEEAKKLCQGTKKQILEYLNGPEYFNTCKKMANK